MLEQTAIKSDKELQSVCNQELLEEWINMNKPTVLLMTSDLQEKLE